MQCRKSFGLNFYYFEIYKHREIPSPHIIITRLFVIDVKTEGFNLVLGHDGHLIGSSLHIFYFLNFSFNVI